MRERWSALINYFVPDDLMKKYPDPGKYLDQLRRARLAISTSIAISICILIMSAFRILIERDVQLSIGATILVGLLFGLSPLISRRFKDFQWPYATLVFLGAHVILYRAITTGGLGSVVISWYALGPICSMLILGRKAAIATTLLILSHLLILLYAVPLGIDIVDVAHQDSVRMIVFSMMLLLVLGVAYIFESGMEHYQKLVSKTESKLNRQEKLVSVGQLAGGVAHEINNPLMVLSGRLGMLQKLLIKDSFDKKMATEQIENSLKMIFRISEITQSLLDYSGAFSDDSRVNTNLGEFVQWKKKEMAPALAEQGATLTLSLPVTQVYLLINRYQVGQVFGSLLDNAILAVKDSDDKVISIEIEETDEAVMVSVSDYGVGVSEKIAERVMEPFFTTRKQGEGRGLGLSTARGIVEQHNGSLTLDRTVSYTKFVMSFKKSLISDDNIDSSVTPITGL